MKRRGVFHPEGWGNVGHVAIPEAEPPVSLWWNTLLEHNRKSLYGHELWLEWQRWLWFRLVYLFQPDAPPGNVSRRGSRGGFVDIPVPFFFLNSQLNSFDFSFDLSVWLSYVQTFILLGLLHFSKLSIWSHLLWETWYRKKMNKNLNISAGEAAQWYGACHSCTKPWL